MNDAAGRRIVVGAAVVLTAVFVIFTGIMLMHFVLPDRAVANWERALLLYNAVASVGFAAVGTLLGAQVKSVDVASARGDAAKAKADQEVIRSKVGEALGRLNDVGDLGGALPAPEAEVVRRTRSILTEVLTR
ncbi:hypothetical protein RQ734_02110 [Roseomonas mucosa]|uniref:hypothetical protein n=1 Tax=Roseomonas mucosa TaxID=207340 RepID=UPI0028CBD4EE|nr:hypothetical protein [Roseomonas mucosa]MDT8274835.1 hypothetical protein [Roseomonas mucosa]MDT8355497.1 hypothetical protein [Roseomonas mucosa]